MHIRTFRAANLNAALAMIREQMGSDASILHTRQVAKGWMPWIHRNQIEVTAGLRHTPRTADDQRLGVAPVRNIVDAGTPEMDTWNRGEGEYQLRNLGVSGSVESHEDVSKARSRFEEDQISPHCTGPLRLTEGKCLKVALVGGCGVGKTTTIAKLAAGFRLAGEVRVGLLTLDTIRAAAREQIEAYARAMDVPLGIVYGHDDLPDAESLFAECDVVFIDTPGHSSKSRRAIEVLGALLRSIGTDQTHLVLDCNHSRQATRANFEAFAPLDPSAVILSKLDDMPEPDEVLSIVHSSSMGVSYLTTGQRVPQDICVAEQEMLLSRSSALASSDQRSVKSSSADEFRREQKREAAMASQSIPSFTRMIDLASTSQFAQKQ